MKLFILKPKEGHYHWASSSDKTFGIVVRAETEDQARIIGSKSHGDEGQDVWLSPEHTACEEIIDQGPAEVILFNFHAG